MATTTKHSASISSCFAISVATASAVDLETLQEMRPSGFAAAHPVICPPGNGKSSDIPEPQIAVKAVALVGIHSIVDSALGGCNTHWQEQQTSSGNRAHESTSLGFHSVIDCQKIKPKKQFFLIIGSWSFTLLYPDTRTHPRSEPERH